MLASFRLERVFAVFILAKNGLFAMENQEISTAENAKIAKGRKSRENFLKNRGKGVSENRPATLWSDPGGMPTRLRVRHVLNWFRSKF
jgi:hypothetical protein